LQIARFGAQKRPAPTGLPEAAAAELRELVRLRTRLMQEVIDRINQLHRLIDLGFPEFTRYLSDLNTELAGAASAWRLVRMRDLT
jgi:transposase